MWSPADIPDLTGRRALVTGVTSGLGEALVEALAQHGAQVVMAARNEEKLERSIEQVRRDVPDADVRPLVLDLAISPPYVVPRTRRRRSDPCTCWSTTPA